jgi:hypothetical protein
MSGSYGNKKSRAATTTITTTTTTITTTTTVKWHAKQQRAKKLWALTSILISTVGAV